jgi:hypothetical protein
MLLATSTVKNCVALNRYITGANTFTGRVLGRNSGGSLANNYARDDMTPIGVSFSGSNTGTDLGGDDFSIGDPLSAVFNTANGYAPAVWSIPSNDLSSGKDLPTLVAAPQSPAPKLP